MNEPLGIDFLRKNLSYHRIFDTRIPEFLQIIGVWHVFEYHMTPHNSSVSRLLSTDSTLELKAAPWILKTFLLNK